MTGSGLNTQPNATTFNLADLVNHAWSGRIRVPRFQRPFRWDVQDVKRLFDSVVRGYPIGSILLWLRPAQAERVTLGALTINAPEMSEALWVVDGQQRITSLANALHDDGAADPRFALAYNLRDESFQRRPGNADDDLIPLPVLFNLQLLIRWFADRPHMAEHLDQASTVARRIREFQVPAYQVKQENEEVLQDIFDRMNNYGKTLSRAEVFAALHAGPESTENLTFPRIAEETAAKFAFGHLSNDLVLRAVLARRGPDVERDIRIEFSSNRRGGGDFPHEDRDVAYDEGRKALHRTVDFLQNHAHVPHISLLPYSYLLVVLTRFFSFNPAPDPRSVELLRRWFWRAAIVGPMLFRGSGTAAARTMNRCIVKNDPQGSRDRLLSGLSETDVHGDISLRSFKTTAASTKIVLCAWWSLHPRSLVRGTAFSREDLANAIDESQTASAAIRDIFTRSSLDQRFRSWAANRLLLPGDGTELSGPPLDSALLQLRTEPNGVKTARSHCLTPEMLAMLARDDVDKFIEARDRALVEQTRNFITRQCAWHFEDTPPLSELLLDDDDEDD